MTRANRAREASCELVLWLLRILPRLKCTYRRSQGPDFDGGLPVHIRCGLLARYPAELKKDAEIVVGFGIIGFEAKRPFETGRRLVAFAQILQGESEIGMVERCLPVDRDGFADQVGGGIESARPEVRQSRANAARPHGGDRPPGSAGKAAQPRPAARPDDERTLRRKSDRCLMRRNPLDRSPHHGRLTSRQAWFLWRSRGTWEPFSGASVSFQSSTFSKPAAHIMWPRQ